MSSRLTDAMSKLNVDNSRSSMGKSPISPAGNKRNSGLDTSTINAMFPDAVAAIAQKRAEYAQQTGNQAPSNRNSAAVVERASLVAPTISAPPETGKDSLNWRSGDPHGNASRPKSSSGQQNQDQQRVPQIQQTQQPPMGHFSQPPLTAGLSRSPRHMGQLGDTIQSTTLTAPLTTDLPAFSPYNVGNQSWASMTNTPMVPNFSMQQAATQSEMIANHTAMKLAALSTMNNRIALDDVRKYRRPRSSEPEPSPGQSTFPGGISNTGIPGINTIVVNDQGQILNAQQIAALQQQQQLAAAGRRSRPNSPGLAMHGGGMGQLNLGGAQNNGYLAAYDGSNLLNPGLVPQIGHYGGGSHDGYISDHSDARGRSPRGRRPTSRPPEDPADPRLLQDIEKWLKTLRLHKYTDNLKDLKWQELIQLDDKALEARGVNALGARNKMLKVRPHFP